MTNTRNEKGALELLHKMQIKMIKRALEPIWEMVKAGRISVKDAANIVFAQDRERNPVTYSPLFQKFIDNCGEVFRNEVHFESGYHIENVGSYSYGKSSNTDAHFLCKLHQHFNGSQYSNPAELRLSIEDILKGKRLLELGCGPGFGLRVFQDLGAKAVGIDIRKPEKAVSGVDIRHGSAVELEELCKGENFDIIYSNDLFASACIDQKNTNRIISASYRQTSPDGKAFHFVTYRKINPVSHMMACWESALNGGRDLEEFEDFYMGLSREELEDMRWTNVSTLDPQFLIRAGYALREYSHENNDLVMVAEKS